MAPFSIPAPCIIPLRLPSFGARKTLDTETRIELMCETYIDHEIFYTLDGTKPQPYAGIVQGSKLYKYQKPFCLPAGKFTIKAIALNARIKAMRSSVVSKCFEVVKSKDFAKTKKVRKKKEVLPEVVVENIDAESAVDGFKEDLIGVDDPCNSVDEVITQSASSSESAPSYILPNMGMCGLETPDISPVPSLPQSPEKKIQGLGKEEVESVGNDSHCVWCGSQNDSIYKFCTQCGQQLVNTPSQLNNPTNQMDSNKMTADCSTMAKPMGSNVGVQRSLISVDRETQTKCSTEIKRRLPSHSPGRGYWHQQLDYICNHLKSYAYNNEEFRHSISEPLLSEIQTVTVSKSEESVKVVLEFTPFKRKSEN